MIIDFDITGEGALLKLIDQLGTLEWKKQQSRFPNSWIGNRFQQVDHSGYPPYCSFRFVKEDPRIVALLKDSIENYKGEIEWMMIGHNRSDLPGINWMICPRRYWEIRDTAQSDDVSAGQYMAENEPEFGPVAYDDMLSLTKYVYTQVLEKL